MMATDENIQVVVRCRPMSKKEVGEGNVNVVEIEPKTVILQNPVDKTGRRFEFDWVFGPQANQREIYLRAAKGIVDNVLRGYNGTIFAYGQTGTGKTFTMEGEGKISQGIIPHTFSHIFEHISKAVENQRFLVRASYIEIYNEEIRDLLAKNASTRLEIRERPEMGVYVTDLSTFIANSPRDLKKIMAAGSRNRAKGATEMNQFSSRSHVIFTTTVECCEPGADGCDHVRVGKLHLVDLAGSERQAKTKASGQRFKEANKINLSLSTLGNVISALVDGKSSHVPYRNSKLTRLLKDSLGGNSKTLMCANIGPADYNYEETLSTLRFASRAKNIKNKARINEDPKDAVLRQLQIEIQELRKKLEEGSGESVESDDEDENTAKKVSEQQRKPKTYTSEQLKAIQDKLKLDKKMLLEQKGIAEEEKKRLEEELKVREKELHRAQQEHKELIEKLRTMEKKIIIGGVNLLKKAEIQEQLLKESARELEENRRMELELQRRLEQQENERLTIEEQYSSLQDDISEKDRKLKKALSLVMNARTELAELQHEHQVDLTEQLEVVRGLSRDLQQTTALIDYFVPLGYQQLLEQNVTWDEMTGEWHLRGVAYAGCNRDLSSAQSPDGHRQVARRLKGDLSAVYFAYTPSGAERALQLKLGMGRTKPRRPKAAKHPVNDPILRQYSDLCPQRSDPCECPREVPWRPFRPCYFNQCPHLGPLLDEFYQLYYYYLTKNMLKSQNHLSRLYQAPFYPRTFFCSRPPVRPALSYT